MDRRSVARTGGVRSRDYQIFEDGSIYLAMGLRKCALRARRAPLRTKLIYTFRDGLIFGEGILNIQVAITALIQVSLYFADAQITKFSYPLCTAARARTLPKMFVVNQNVQNAKINLCHAAAILSQEI